MITLENVWNSPLFAPWKGESEQSSVLALPVYLHNPTYKMTALSLGEQQLWINEVHHQRMKKFASVFIVPMCHSHSASQSKRVFVIFYEGKLYKSFRKRIALTLRYWWKGHKVWASISKWAFNELHFAQGMDVYVQIKAISVV